MAMRWLQQQVTLTDAVCPQQPCDVALKETEAEGCSQMPAELSPVLIQNPATRAASVCPTLSPEPLLVQSLRRLGNLPGQKLSGQVIIFNNVPASSSSMSQPCHSSRASGSTSHFSAVPATIESPGWTVHYLLANFKMKCISQLG